MADKVIVEGLSDLDQKLQDLGQIAGKKVLRGAMFDAMRPVFRDARANAETIEDSGALAASMARWFKQVSRNKFLMFVGPRSRSKRAVDLWTQHHGRPPKGGRIRHGHLQEFGTEHHGAQPFLRPAFDSNQAEMISILVRRLRERISRLGRAGK